MELIAAPTIQTRYDIPNRDGSITPFYPILSAIEWGVITREDISKILFQRFRIRAHEAYLQTTVNTSDCIIDSRYLAWGFQNGIFDPIELEKFRFSIGAFISEYGNPNLMEEAVEDLIHSRSEIFHLENNISNRVYGFVQPYPH